MPKILEYVNVGNRENLTVQELLLIVEKLYLDIAINLNKKVELVEQDQDGSTSDTFLSNGTLHINTSTLKVQLLTSHDTATTVTYQTLL